MERKERTIFITVLANLVLIVMRFFLAGLSGSIGLKANAWHSFTDVFVSSVVFIGLMAVRLGAGKWKGGGQASRECSGDLRILFHFLHGNRAFG